MDVTEARQYIREHKARTGESLSFTAFVITCLAKAVDANKEVHAHLNWWNQLVIFDEVNVNMMIEVESEGQKVPIPHVIKAATRPTYTFTRRNKATIRLVSGSTITVKTGRTKTCNAEYRT